MNELQYMFGRDLRGMADAIFRNGDLVQDCRVTIKTLPGQDDTVRREAHCESGLVYLAGAVRPVAEAVIGLPAPQEDEESLPAIGIHLKRRVVTEIEDPTLYNIALGVPGEGEPGAARLLYEAVWGLATDSLDGALFYPVHTVDEEGHIDAKEPPPSLDAVTQALARYDRDSSGGSYVISGLEVLALEDDGDDQVYTVAAGRARVGGFAVALDTARRLNYPAVPDIQLIDTEPHFSATAEPQRIILNRYPAGKIHKVRITRQSTATVTRGAYAGGQDILPESPVVAIEEIRQGETVYAKTDYSLTGGRVDWSPGGSEPAPGSTYTVRYQHLADAEAQNPDSGGFTLTGAVPTTQIWVTYDLHLPRQDQLCLNKEGRLIWVQGVASGWNPKPPAVDDDFLPLATVHQTWDDTRTVRNDGVRVVPMDEIAAINDRLDLVVNEVAQNRLTTDIFTREAGAKRGMFVDPFLSDEMRDQGLEQTAAIIPGVLTLPVVLDQVAEPDGGLRETWQPEASPVTVLEQLRRTGFMKVNPYDAFEPLPAEISLNPAIDRWTEVRTTWASALTRPISGWVSSQRTSTQLVSSTTAQLEYLRQIPVKYEITCFGPGEKMTMTFDGLPVTPSQAVADDSGVISGSFTIPAGIPAGQKKVVATGSGGSRGEAVFSGQGQITNQTLRLVTTVVTVPVDPLAQTFILSEACQIFGTDLWFTARGTSRVVVQIRETTVGFPNRTVLGEAIIDPSAIILGGKPTRINFKTPVALSAETEYALTILCDDSTTALSIAELGQWDVVGNCWVTSQPYQVGVLLSSSNANTWTAHQTRDLTFRLLKAVYKSGKTEKELGQVNVHGATDLMLLASAEQPDVQGHVEYHLTIGDQLVVVSDGQPIRLAEPFTGPVSIKACLTSEGKFASVLYPGAQLISVAAAAEADYISRALPAGQNSAVKVILDVHLPAGAGIIAQMRPDGQSQWLPLTSTGSSPLDNGWHELTWGDNTDADMVRIRLVLTGNSSARPQAANLRVLTI
ncbi:DUF4815 domain-containing protein [Deltaproteobacteria bacterium Smac51]|nr:DUF4815 domain-containing protein [Deltaproteobacteria bacterium Smac51]